MLAERRVKFFEQKVLGSEWYAPLKPLFDHLEKGSFTKLWLEKADSPLCLQRTELLEFGTSFDLYAQGMKASECLAGAIVASPAGRYRMYFEYQQALGATFAKYSVIEGSNGEKVASIRSAKVNVSEAAAKSPFPRLFDAGCYANQQTVANLFDSKTGNGGNQLPQPQLVTEPRQTSGVIKFFRTDMPRESFLKLDSNTSPEGIMMASKTPQRAIEVADGHFISQYKFLQETRALPTKDGIVIPQRNKATFLWRSGEIQSLEVTTDDGPILNIDGYRISAGKLLYWATTDYTKGWAVFEANLTNFNISTAREGLQDRH